MRILSGIQSSGILHIGNYFGMMRPAIALPARTEILSRFPFSVSRALGRGPCEKGRLLLECAVP